MRCLPVPNRPEDEVFYEIPGGDAKGKETPEDTARREPEEEVGIEIPPSAQLIEVYREEAVAHSKHGFQVRSRECKGSIRKDAHDDGNKRIVGTEWVDVDEAPNFIRPAPEGRSQHDFLVALSKVPFEVLI
jgi:8-oxo-dGTP pyrophosphatase MutT (NUDIX family)